MAIRVLLADDHTVLRDGMHILLETQGDISVIGEAGDGRAVVVKAQQVCPDVVLMDIAMPELNGIEATAQVCQTCPSTQVVILSMYVTAEHIFRAFQAGARGYLLKDSAGTEVVHAIRAVYAGKRYLSQRIDPALLDAAMRQYQTVQTPSPIEQLSPRERQVLQLVVEGYSSAEIAQRLSFSPKTVETYRSRLMRKLGIRDLPSLVRFAILHGLTPLR